MENPSTILVVDDESTVHDTLDLLLSDNYRLYFAGNGQQGLAMAEHIKPDVILLDVMMPDMNGYEVCKRIRATPQIAEVPIFMVTALDDRDAKLNGLAAGADDFLTKPFDILELKIRLQTLQRVDRYRQLQNEREKLRETLHELSEKHTQLRTMARQVLEAQENERRRVAVELHDDIGQRITGLKLLLERDNKDHPATLVEARAIAGDLLNRLREVSLNLRPTDLDDLGLSAALVGLFKRFTNQTGVIIRHNVNILDERRFGKTIETTVFRVVQEALTNITRHSGATEATITLIMDPDRLRVSIVDTGQGFDVDLQDLSASTGISAMKERVQLAGGRFAIQSALRNGTLVVLEFDLKQTE